MDSILSEVFKDIGIASPTIAYVGAANEDNPAFFERMAGMIRAANKCRIIHAVTVPDKANIKKAVEIINSADAVFVSGGDVEAGMEVLEKKGIVRHLPRTDMSRANCCSVSPLAASCLPNNGCAGEIRMTIPPQNYSLASEWRLSSATPTVKRITGKN